MITITFISQRHHSVTRLKEILARWIEIAERNDIPYMLTYGSLLAAWRDSEVVQPWDTDLDIYTMDWDNNKLNNIQNKRNFDTYSEEFHLVLDIDWKVSCMKKPSPGLRAKKLPGGCAPSTVYRPA